MKWKQERTPILKLTTLVFITVAFSSIANAHQPILNDEDKTSPETAYVINKPEISKAIFSQLNGAPQYYRIDSKTDFAFYAGLTQPKISTCPIVTSFSFDVLDSNLQVIDSVDGKSFEWWEWYEEFGKDWYWVGPELGKEFKSDRIYEAGTYYIRVFNGSNEGQYVLAVGDVEKFTLPVIARTIFTMPKINSRFWNDRIC
jgi:hypothetical protein